MNPHFRSGLRIVILAAGFSSRLGASKAHARIRGTTLLRRTLGVTAGLTAARVVIVVPHDSARARREARGFKVAFVVNGQRAKGLSSSVRAGIARVRNASAVLILPVDLAALRRRELARLIARWLAGRRRVVARRIGQSGDAARSGAPVILPHWLFPRVQQLTGDIGLRELVGGLPAEQRVLADLPSAEPDVDTPEDLRSARRRRGATL
jgi:molybdenum cofactor cytidylyltransferase